MLEIIDIEKRYQSHLALDKVSLTIPQNSIYGLLGPNGAGKTTLIRIINQIVYQDSGKVYLDGEILRPEHIAQIGYMPEERGLYKTMKIGEQAMYLAQLKGMSKQEAKKQIQYWFERFQIEGWWDKKIGELSKGMAQKVQFIVTVLHQPKLLIFDEPFSGFDPVNAEIIKDEILMLKENGATVIFSTHRMESVEELCDSIALLHQGKKVLEGDIKKIKRDFRTNTFQIGIFPKKENILNALQQKWNCIDTSFPTIDNELQFQIQIPETMTTSALLADLNLLGEVAHFTEKIPSVNEIFINAVKKKS